MEKDFEEKQSNPDYQPECAYTDYSCYVKYDPAEDDEELWSWMTFQFVWSIITNIFWGQTWLFLALTGVDPAMRAVFITHTGLERLYNYEWFPFEEYPTYSSLDKL